MSITKSQVIIVTGEPIVEKPIKRKAVFSPLCIGDIVKEHNLVRTVNRLKQAKDLPPQSAEADEANTFHLVATKLRYLNR